MDGARPKLAPKRIDVARENHIPRLKNRINNETEVAEQHKSNGRKRKIVTVTDICNRSESELNGNLTKKKKKPIHQENEGDFGKGLMDVYKVNKAKNGVEDTKQQEKEGDCRKVNKAKNGVKDIKQLVRREPQHNSVSSFAI